MMRVCMMSCSKREIKLTCEYGACSAAIVLKANNIIISTYKNLFWLNVYCIHCIHCNCLLSGDTKF